MSNLVLTEFTQEQVALIKREVAQGCTDDELSMFLHHAQKSGLDPLARQIYMIRRRQWDHKTNGYIERASIQVGIDGFRVIADRTNQYAPGEEKFEYNDAGLPTVAHVSLKKLVAGTWHDVWASAYWDEYAQLSKDGKPAHMWSKMPRVMLAKVAEAKALRKAFPAQLSGLYTADEMAQAENAPKILEEKDAFKDAKGAVLIESDYPAVPQGQHPVDKLGKLNKEQQEVYHNIADKLVELCGTNGKLMEETLVMATEWRDKETNQVNSPGVKTPLSLMYAKRGKQPKSQAEFALDNLNKLTKETLMSAISEWKSQG